MNKDNEQQIHNPQISQDENVKELLSPTVDNTLEDSASESVFSNENEDDRNENDEDIVEILIPETHDKIETEEDISISNCNENDSDFEENSTVDPNNECDSERENKILLTERISQEELEEQEDENLEEDDEDELEYMDKETLLSEVESDNLHPAEIAEQFELLTFEEQVDVLKNMAPDDAAETLAELDDEHAGEMLENLSVHEATAIIAEMSPDDAVDVLDEIDEEQRDTILNNMEMEDAEELRNLLSFDPETAAGIMNTEMLLLPFNATPDDVIHSIRESMDDLENIYYVYLVDENDVLCTVISMRDLMRMSRNMKISEIVNTKDVITIPYDMDQKEIAQLFTKYSFLSLPVVDREGRVLGMITHDDVIDIIHDSASADMLGMVGAGQDEDSDTPWHESVKMRLPWLLVNLLTSSLSACVVYFFNGTIAQMALLAVLMPIVANQSGNTGQQALAVMIRQLALESFVAKKAMKAVFREMKIGMASSLILSIIAYACVRLVFQDETLALVVAIALCLDMVLGAVLGASIPLILRRLGRDPAQASSIFLTAITDGMGFFIFLSLASIVLLGR